MALYFNITFNSIGNATSKWLVDKQWLNVWFGFALTESAVGGCLSFILIILILTNRKLRTGCGILVAHLTFLDFLVSALHSVINSVFLYNIVHIHSDYSFSCRYSQFFYRATMHTRYWAACFLAVNRFVAIQWPHSYKKVTSPVHIACSILLCWMIGIGLNLPFLVGRWGSFGMLPGFAGCGIIEGSSIVARNIQITCAVYIPLILIGVIYVFILFKTISLREKIMSLKTDAVRRKEIQFFRRRVVVARMLFVSALWYYACYLPLTIMLLTLPAFFTNNPQLQFWMRTLFLAGYAFNPVVFFALNSDYRQALTSITRKIPIQPVASTTRIAVAESHL